MKRFIFIVLLLVFVSETTKAQKIKIELGYGIAGYSMTDLKSFNDLILKNLPVEGKITDNFPSQPYETVTISSHISKTFIVGITGSYYTTGSRVSYKDYSGEYRFDNVLNSYNPGILIGTKLYAGAVNISLLANASYSFVDMKFKETMMDNSQTDKFKSNSFSVLPELKIARKIKMFEVSLNAGYMYDFEAPYTLSNGNGKLKNSETNKEIRNNWSGYRFSLNLGYCFD
jgi:hypothetical protein